MNRLLSLSLLLLSQVSLADYASPGPFGANRFTGNYAHGGASYPYELHVPCASGNTCTNASPAGNSGGPYPVVALGHGFCNQPENYRNFGALLASRGMVVVAPKLECNFLTSDPGALHAGNAQRLLAALDQVLALGNAGGVLAGRLDAGRTALAGHSGGGLSALVAAGARPSVKALVLLDGVDAGSGSRASPVPTLMLNTAGSSCNSNNNNASWYGLVTAGQPRSRMRVVGADHCDMQEPLSSACSFTGCAGSSPASVRPVFLRHTAAWLSLYLGCEASAVDTVAEGGADFQADLSAGRIADVDQSGVSAPSSCPGGTGADAGQPEDAGIPDAGPPATDAGSGVPGPDAGQPTADAGEPFDAGAPSGGGVDEGLPADGGAVVDAGDGEAVPPVGCGCGALPLPLALAWTLLPAWALRRRRLA
jgi:dienelactone hydrolase